jgi:hypothetical protein
MIFQSKHFSTQLCSIETLRYVDLWIVRLMYVHVRALLIDAPSQSARKLPQLEQTASSECVEFTALQV